MRTVRLDPIYPVSDIQTWLDSNTIAKSEITWANHFTDYRTKKSVWLTVEVEFHELDDAVLFELAWTNRKPAMPDQ